jgi:hypothetical protein
MVVVLVQLRAFPKRGTVVSNLSNRTPDMLC